MKLYEDTKASILASIVLLGGAWFASGYYYLHESQPKIVEENINNSDIYMNENGEFCLHFNPGEHIITISRNDAYYHKIEPVNGYTIKEVEINGWRDNNKVTYVNTEPVTVVATMDKNGKLLFNNFGTVDEKQLTLNK